MNDKALIEAWQREEQQPFTGWDFSYLRARMIEEPPPWSYQARAEELLKRASTVLDIDTGGGERMVALREHWPARVVTTEAYPPNVALAASRLVPAGAALVAARSTESDMMPFRDGAFDLVLNRHGGFNPTEIGRVLKAGGIFYTEQVHGLWAHDLLSSFDIEPSQPIGSPERYVPQLEAAGLRMRQVRDFTGRLQFLDVGAIVYYLKAVPWMIPGFSVSTHKRYLNKLQVRLDRKEMLVFTSRLYLIEAEAN